jgi:hypothetical protein
MAGSPRVRAAHDTSKRQRQPSKASTAVAIASHYVKYFVAGSSWPPLRTPSTRARADGVMPNSAAYRIIAAAARREMLLSGLPTNPWVRDFWTNLQAGLPPRASEGPVPCGPIRHTTSNKPPVPPDRDLKGAQVYAVRPIPGPIRASRHRKVLWDTLVPPRAVSARSSVPGPCGTSP